MIQITDLAPQHRDAFLDLWQAYLAFYDEELPETTTAATWARLMDPAAAMKARIGGWRAFGLCHPSAPFLNLGGGR
jgi:hypothetical protein